MTILCEVNCCVAKIKLQTQTSINASTHTHCSYHELFQRCGTEKEKLTFWYGCQKKYVRLELLLSGLSNFIFFSSMFFWVLEIRLS